jgi:hypothetical protein
MSRIQRDKNGLRNDGSHTFPDIPCRPEKARHGSGDDCFEAMCRHHERQRQGSSSPPAAGVPISPANGTGGGSPAGDIIYGAEAIAKFIFDDYAERDPKQCRRRVYHLWNHYRDRNDRAGFLKLNGALCLSKSQWRNFHGLD